MNWFFIAILAPFLWSISNFVDKYLLSSFFKNKGIGALLIFSSLVSIIMMPIFFVMDRNVLEIPLSNIIILVLGGIISVLAILFYLYAINKDDASTVVPFFQLIPVFLYIFGYFLLGESLQKNEIIAGILIIIGAGILSLEIQEDKSIKIKKKLVFLMILSSMLYALYEVLFKFIAIENSFWVSNFWQHFGLLLSGFVFFIFFKKFRTDFISLFKNSKSKIISLNIFNEIITIIGNLFMLFAILLAPIAVVGLVNAYQPLMVFVMGILLTKFIPKLYKEKIDSRNIYQKIFAIVVIFIGTYLLY